MSIYLDLLESANQGRRFKVDLVDKSLWIDKKQIIKKGVVLDGTKTLIEHGDCFMFNNDQTTMFFEYPWSWIQHLYDLYKRSVPCEHGNTHSYFKALSVDALTTVDLTYNPSRDLMQAALEGYILLASLQGWLKWEFNNKWFWQCPLDSNLVVMKNWIE